MRDIIMLLDIALLALVPNIVSAIDGNHDTVVLQNNSGAVSFDTDNGSIVALTQKGQPGRILSSGEEGLWLVRFADGSQISAADFSSSSTGRSFEYTHNPQANALQMTFQSPEIRVFIGIRSEADGIEFTGEITPHSKTVLDFAMPARLRFKPDALDRFICPMNGNQSVGTAFNSVFFQRQPQEEPAAWETQLIGPKGYAGITGGDIEHLEDEAPATLHVTPEGRRWFGSGLADRLEGARALVNRPSPRGHANLVLVDSGHGPYFAASNLAGTGALWRVGGRVDNREKQNVKDMVMAVIQKLIASSPREGRKLGLLALKRGPERGGWTAIRVDEWLSAFQSISASEKSEVIMETLTSPKAMVDALKSQQFLAILNPYGEWIPVPGEGDTETTLDNIREYVKAGGHWFEVGGYPFYYALQPVRYLHYSVPYPAAFADFFHLDTHIGPASIYRVQSGSHAPWEGAKNPDAIFVPGRLAIGGDERGGYCDRTFGTYVPAGESWRSPAVRMVIGQSAAESLQDYCEANGIGRHLEDKMPPEVLEKFRNSVLVYYGGNCREKLEHLDLLPVPSQIHFADYLKGGFDKQYPDHLPPRPDFGTPEEFRAFFERCQQLGHLISPYTNPTWWCDDPKGPTFEKEGEAPLLHNLDGSLSRERYGANEGYTICHWHPAVRAANQKTVRQFTEEYPVDILFQDQCGARSWRYDTNPASPTPYAYIEGLLSMIAEDCQTRPLSTESGWDRVVNYESQLCGMSWSIVPTVGGPSWRTFMKHQYPPETWKIFPLAQYIAHDKAAMLYHDLGQFVTNRQVLAWTLGLGFCMSYRISAPMLKQDARREWLRWLDRIQKSVCSRYVGEPVNAFEHDRGSAIDLADDGVLRAGYGDVEIVANLGPKERVEQNRELLSYGFYATAPGMVAANLKRLGGLDFGDDGISFVTEEVGQDTHIWVYEYPGTEVRVELPNSRKGDVSLVTDDGSAIQTTVKDSMLRFRLPGKVTETRYLCHIVAHYDR
jgi:hypothetical protein